LLLLHENTTVPHQQWFWQSQILRIQDINFVCNLANCCICFSLSAVFILCTRGKISRQEIHTCRRQRCNDIRNQLSSFQICQCGSSFCDDSYRLFYAECIFKEVHSAS
jgi:hypothetical protein